MLLQTKIIQILVFEANKIIPTGLCTESVEVFEININED